jgi:hemolysin III
MTQSEPPQPYRFLLEKRTVGAFLVFQGVLLTALYALWHFVSPATLAAQWHQGAWKLAAAFLIAHFAWAIFEMFFHRYVLHLAVIPGLAVFTKKHRAHHDLTPVRLADQEGAARVVNHYPIVEEHQRAHSVFPWYATPIFFLVATPMLFGFQLVFPMLPMFLGGYGAVSFSYVLYEIIHAYEHRSYELWWRPRMHHPRLGGYWRSVYAFHLAHHAVPRVNEAVGGFLGLPVADWVFGTYYKPKSLFQSEDPTVQEDFRPPRGYLFIRTLDRLLLPLNRIERP